mgnify:CR=1 FL=1
MSKTEDGSMFRKRNPTIHPVTYPSSPPKLNKKGGNRPVPATGLEGSRQDGEDVTDVDLDVIYNSIELQTPMRIANTSPKLQQGNRSSSSALLTACHSPFRGYDPD